MLLCMTSVCLEKRYQPLLLFAAAEHQCQVQQLTLRRLEESEGFY